MTAGDYGERIADMGVEAPPTLSARVLRQSSIAITRLTCDARDHAMTPSLPLEDAYILSLELRDTFHQMWVDGRQVPLGLIKQGTTLLVDLNHRTECIPARSFDTLPGTSRARLLT
jgi:AraC family transcriptional regulator